MNNKTNGVANMMTQANDNVAQTILNQLGGTGRLIAMTGAKHIMFDDDSVCFKFKGSKKTNYCKITLNSSDTYTVEFGKVKKFDYAQKFEFKGIFADSLVRTFETITGLSLSL